MDVRFKVTNVFKKNEEAYHNPKLRYIVNSGGSRSSKTYSILQLFVTILMQKQNYKISCYRNLRIDCIDTVGQDFKNIIELSGLSDKFVHNIKDAKWVCKASGSVIYFAGTEKIHKALGQQNNIIFLNEISEFSLAVFNQLDQRTRDKVFIDYNPSKDFWIESYRENESAEFLHSTYKDNPFLTRGIISKLQSYNPYEVDSTYVENGQVYHKGFPVSEKNQPPPNRPNIKNNTADKYLYEVYCLGLGSEKPNRIYTGWKTCEDQFFHSLPYEKFYGLDFGVSSPTAVVEVCFDGDRTFYINEILYKPSNEMGMTLGEYLQQKRASGKPLVDRDKIIVCDSAKKSMVLDLAKQGLNAVPALKGQGSVSRTISSVQSFNVVYTKSSLNLKEEYFEYSWKLDRYGLADESPELHKPDHLMDSTGYVISWMINYLAIGVV
jgi:phage terminase large subunit|tara:strand:+ start:612 stop:1919 length:1308 start_codon:yes stop_codon:yes gene_type:complete